MAFFGFTLTLTQGANTRVISNLEIETIVAQDEAKEGWAFMRRVFNAQFPITGGDFSWLYAIETDADRCDEISAVLEHTDGYTWNGLLKLSETQWRVEDCTVSVKLSPDDKEACLESLILDDEFNLLEPSRDVYDLYLYEGTIEYNTIGFVGIFDTSLYPFPTVDASDPAWAIQNINATWTTGYDGTITWARQVITTNCVAGSPSPPDTPGWVLRENNCGTTSTAKYSKPVYMVPDPEVIPTDDGVTWRVSNIVPGANARNRANTALNVSGGRLLNQLLIDIFDGSCPATVISDFLNINPVGDAPANDAYAVAPQYHHILIFQRSDIRLPNATQDATVGLLTLKKVLETLNQVLRLEWGYDSAGNFRIEHESYFHDTNGTDLTSPASTIISRTAYERLSDKYPRFERFAWDESYRQQDFEGQDIIYANACGSDVKQYNGGISTDIGTVLARPDLASDSGFMWVAAKLQSGQYRAITVPGALSGVELLNGYMAWANLQDPLHAYRRPFAVGQMNGASRTMESVIPTRRESVVASLCPSDFHAIDMDEKVRSKLGWGEVDAAAYDYRTQEATFTLLQ